MKMFYTQKSNYGITRSWKEGFNINASLVFARKCSRIEYSLAALAFAICTNNNKKTLITKLWGQHAFILLEFRYNANK